MKLLLPKTFMKLLFIALLLLGQLSFGQTTTLFNFSGTSSSSYSATPATGWTSSGSAGGSYLKLSPGSVTSPIYAAINDVVFKYDIAAFGSGSTNSSTKLIILSATNTVIIEYTLTSAGSSTYIEDQTVNIGNISSTFKIKIEGFGNGSSVRGTRLQNYSLVGTAAPTGPIVNTTAATIITVNGSTLNGTINANGISTAASFQYGLTTTYGSTIAATPATVTGTTATSISATVGALALNTEYHYRAIGTVSSTATNGGDMTFYTLATTPGVLLVSNPSQTTLDITVNTTTQNSNPTATEYAIQVNGGQYVQANGTLGATAVWRTATLWATTTVTGLSTATTYTFQTKARNGANVQTAFGGSASGTTAGPIVPVVSGGSSNGIYNTAFSYSIIAINLPTSYAIASGTLPAGLTLNNTTGVISGKPTAVGTSSVTVTAANSAGTSSEATLTFNIAKSNQAITFATLANRVYGSADFNLSATTSSGLAVSYVSSNEAVATVSGNSVTILGVGSTNITASQGGDANYNVAADVVHTLTVTPKALTIIGLTANNKVQDGTITATLSGTATLNGVILGDDVVLSGAPTATFADATVGNGKAVTITGYSITGTKAVNYTVSQPTGLSANITALGTPVATAATAILSDGFTANWDAVAGATGYEIDVYEKTGSEPAELVLNGGFENGNKDNWSGTNTTFNISDISPKSGIYKVQKSNTTTNQLEQLVDVEIGKSYVFSFWYNDYNASGANGLKNFTIQGTSGSSYIDIGAPKLSSALIWTKYEKKFTATQNKIKISIRAYEGVSIDDISLKLEGNSIVLSPISGSPFTVIAPSTSYQVTGLNPETNYYYVVRAKSNTITTVDSNEIEVTTIPTPIAVIWDGTSWSNTTGPDATTDVFIQGEYDTATYGEFAAKGIVIDGDFNGSLTINSGTSVTIVNGLENNLSATAVLVENNANLIQLNDSNNINDGEITVKRNSSPLKRLDYTLWSSPVQGQELYDFSPATVSNRFYNYNTATDQYSNAVGFDLENLAFPTGVVAPNGVNGNEKNKVQFETAKSYLIRIPYNHPSTATTWTGQFTGTPNNGDITYPLSTDLNGYNAVGNPYPSALDLEKFIDANILPSANNINGTLWFWRKTNNAANPVAYTTITKAGIASNENGVSYIDDKVISVGQGFIVKATSNTLNFDNSMRSTITQDQFFKQAPKNRYWIRLTNAAAVNFGEALVAYIDGATLAYDNGYDGLFINDTKTKLLTLAGDKEVVIQARPVFDAQDVLPMLFKTDVKGIYTINLSQAEGVFNKGQAIYLKDNLNNSLNDLSASAYTFSSEIGNFPNRFEIVYQKSLAVSNPTFNENQVIVYNKNQELTINSGTVMMDDVKVFDIQGRLLYNKTNVNASEIKINTTTKNEILLVKITSKNKEIVTKKVIN